MFYMSFLNFSKEVASDLTLSEKINQVLTTGIGGYILVFAVLAIIWLILALFGKLFDKKSKEVKTETVKVVSAEPAPVAAVAPVREETDDTAVVAAIVAAISAYSGKPANGFRVVSFRKKH